MMADLLGYSELPIWERQMATKGRPQKEDLPERLLRKIEIAVAADQQLYDTCKSKFISQFASADFGEDLEFYKKAMEAKDTWGASGFWQK